MKEQLKNVIKSYLDERASADELFSKTYAKENKNIDECCNYILGEARKKGNAVFMSDAEVYGLAVHYYDEDNIKAENITSQVEVTSSVAANKIAGIAEAPKKHKEPAKKVLKKEIEDPRQMSLF